MKAEGRRQIKEKDFLWFCILPSALCLSFLLRVPGLFTDFWGDEIWSWHIAGQLHSVLGVLFAEPALIDNNHPLNTIWLYFLGQNAPVWAYRLPALLAGVGSMWIAFRIMRRVGRAEAVFAAFLFTFSYPLIFYSSEARGYSLCVLLSLLSFDFLQTALLTPGQKSYRKEILFGVFSALGFLAHLTFLNIYIAAIAWSMVRIRRLEPTTAKRFIRLARLHAIPLAFALLLFHFFIRNMVYGGAAPTAPEAVLLQTLSLTLGGPGGGVLGGLVACMAGLFFIAGLCFLARQGSDLWVFFAFAVVIAPAMICARTLLFSERPQPLMLRYFLICIALLLLSVVPLLTHLWRSYPTHRPILYGAMAIYLCANAAHIGVFLALGRGHYSEALAFIAGRSPAETLSLASDNVLRTEPLLEFYGPRIARGRVVTLSGSPEEWLILNRSALDSSAFIDFKSYRYTLTGKYPSIDLSGWTWLVYKREALKAIAN